LVFRDTNCFVNPVSAVGPVIERSLIRNPDWTVTIFWALLPSAGSLVSVCDQPPPNNYASVSVGVKQSAK
jgi:hypothetical protein